MPPPNDQTCAVETAEPGLRAALGELAPGASLLLTDLHQLTLLEACLDRGVTATASFEFFVRSLPARRGFLLAAGLEQALAFLETVRVTEPELDWLRRRGGLKASTLDWLEGFRFTGDVDAMPEGGVCFENEPILRVTAPPPMAQLVESRLVNILHFQTLVASKAARMVLAAPGKRLIDVGLDRAHGSEAGLMAARAAYLAGFEATATALAGALWDVPVSDALAHAFVPAFDDAADPAAKPRPFLAADATEAAQRTAVALAPTLAARGVHLRGARLANGDMAALSRQVRGILDGGGLAEARIFASGGLDEDDLARFTRDEAPIDGYGVGASLATSSDAPALDCAYALEAYAGVARRRRSTETASWPGCKQVWRRCSPDGRMARDILSTVDDVQEGRLLIHPVMRAGRRVRPPVSLAESRAFAAQNLALLPEPLRRLEPFTYLVEAAPRLRRLADDLDRRLGHATAVT